MKPLAAYLANVAVFCFGSSQLVANVTQADEAVLQTLPVYSWPDTRTNTYALIGGAESGFYLALTDAKMREQRLSSDRSATITEYESVLDPQRRFVFVCSPFAAPARVGGNDRSVCAEPGADVDSNTHAAQCLEEEIVQNFATPMAFAKKCLSSGNFLDLPHFSQLAQMTWSASFFAGAERSMPMVIGTFSYGRQCFVELFFVHNGCGCALVASCDQEDRPTIDSWLNFFTEAALHLVHGD